MKVYVGRWDCSTCGHKGIKGPETECPSCGADRPKDVQFYLADETDIVQDQEQLRQARAGADWRCSYCGQNNPADTTICTSCGNPRSDEEERLKQRDYYSKAVPRSGATTAAEVTTITPPKKQGGKGCLWMLLGLAVVLVGLVIIFGQTDDIVVTVEAFRWERSIQTEVERLVEEEDWELPIQGKLIRSFRAVHHYDQVLDHYETRTRTQQRAVGTEQYVCGKRDLGNGYFEDQYCDRTIYESYEEQYEEPIYRQEPIYRTKYRYNIYRWQTSAPLETSGLGKQAYWSDLSALQNDPHRRASDRNATYTITVRDELGEHHEHSIPFETWERLNKGDALKALRGTVSGNYRGLHEPWAD